MSEKESKNTLLLIDTFYFLHRSFHAYDKDLQNSQGEYTNIVFGFAQLLLNSISEFNPTHIACGWESEDQPSFRKELYPQYQINRVPMEIEDEMVFSEQLPRVIELIEAFNIPRFTENGFEGDDVLGTAANLASKDADVIVSTSDKDLLQLITDKINVFRPASPPYVPKMLFNKENFKEKYGFVPELMIDYKALRGDPSDNIPGVKGVGDKTATNLICQFGTIESIYENLEKIESNAIRNKLEKDRDNAFMSKQLATIITDIPMEFNLADCEVHDFSISHVRAIFEELEFSSLMKRLDRLDQIKDIKEKMAKEKEEAENQMQLF